MHLYLQRVHQDRTRTLGIMTCDEDPSWCFCTLEDPYNDPKVPGNTCIPEGTYTLQLRTSSPMADRYRERFGASHIGMLWLQDVPNFEYVYLHVGNDPSDTEGCILVGHAMSPKRGVVEDSMRAYKDLFPIVTHLIEKGENVQLTIEDVRPR